MAEKNNTGKILIFVGITAAVGVGLYFALRKPKVTAPPKTGLTPAQLALLEQQRIIAQRQGQGTQGQGTRGNTGGSTGSPLNAGNVDTALKLLGNLFGGGGRSGGGRTGGSSGGTTSGGGYGGDYGGGNDYDYEYSEEDFDYISGNDGYYGEYDYEYSDEDFDYVSDDYGYEYEYSDEDFDYISGNDNYWS
jgi:hypothetical protein